MQLNKFRIKKKLTYKQLADLIGLTNKTGSSTVHRWCTGSRIPRKDMIEKIKLATKNKVTIKDFYEI
jgi:transcriptional regulator with XRE-family HTH domain|tara:strand:- start:1462 stop:1662 length:201 start_codon:yes stop_codon:yes gene_type:complete